MLAKIEYMHEHDHPAQDVYASNRSSEYIQKKNRRKKTKLLSNVKVHTRPKIYGTLLPVSMSTSGMELFSSKSSSVSTPCSNTQQQQQKTLAFLPGYYFAHKFLSIILTQKSMLNDDLATLSQVYLIPYSFVMKTSGISLLYLSPHPSLRSTIYPFRFFHFPLSDFVMGVYSKVCKKTNKSFLSLTVPIKIRQR